jgi:hypothetical protein
MALENHSRSHQNIILYNQSHNNVVHKVMPMFHNTFPQYIPTLEDGLIKRSGDTVNQFWLVSKCSIKSLIDNEAKRGQTASVLDSRCLRVMIADGIFKYSEVI